eukprot:1290216-Rhodomonas_salina.1
MSSTSTERVVGGGVPGNEGSLSKMLECNRRLRDCVALADPAERLHQISQGLKRVSTRTGIVTTTTSTKNKTKKKQQQQQQQQSS